jgi:poly(hydroxyalkanoate) depolymerase family esterase
LLDLLLMYLKTLIKISSSTVIILFTHILLAMSLLFSAFSIAENLPLFTPLNKFSDNPGELTASYFSPKNKSAQSPLALVVLLHGCAQNGEQLAQQSGLAALAQQHGFILLVPQQAAENNFKSCFNWFSSDNLRDSGESLSIKNMILTLKNQTMAKNVYILGLSAGGAMASAMLVNYPEMFTAGAVVAGIAYPCADGLIKAIACMRSGPSQTVAELTKLANQLNDKAIHWPKLIVFTGNNDTIVNPKNGQYLAQQWATLAHFNSKSMLAKNGYNVSRWKNVQGVTQVELVEIANLAHGMAVDPTIVAGGVEAPFLLKAPISAAKNIINFWGLNDKSE